MGNGAIPEMSFTVRDMLDLEVLNNIDVVAGYEGLNNKVENITFLDAPDAVKWLRGSEFIITTLYLFRDTSEQLKLIELLAAKNVFGSWHQVKPFCV